MIRALLRRTNQAGYLRPIIPPPAGAFFHIKLFSPLKVTLCLRAFVVQIFFAHPARPRIAVPRPVLHQVEPPAASRLAVHPLADAAALQIFPAYPAFLTDGDLFHSHLLIGGCRSVIIHPSTHGWVLTRVRKGLARVFRVPVPLFGRQKPHAFGLG